MNLHLSPVGAVCIGLLVGLLRERVQWGGYWAEVVRGGEALNHSSLFYTGFGLCPGKLGGWWERRLNAVLTIDGQSMKSGQRNLSCRPCTEL